MKIPDWLMCYGDLSFRGKCPKESAEQITFFNKLRREYPDSYGMIAIHPRNEGKRTHAQTSRQKAEGMTKGASDIIIPSVPSFICELKRQDHTQSKWQDGQIEYLEAAKCRGCFVCVAMGWKAAWVAFNEWRLEHELGSR